MRLKGVNHKDVRAAKYRETLLLVGGLCGPTPEHHDFPPHWINHAIVYGDLRFGPAPTGFCSWAILRDAYINTQGFHRGANTEIWSSMTMAFIF